MIYRLEGGPTDRPGVRLAGVEALDDRLMEMPEYDKPVLNVADRHTGKQGSWAPDEPRRHDAEGHLILSWQGWR